MKKITSLLILLLIGFSATAQVLNYNRTSLLFSREGNSHGSARSMALKNSFGALGGDLSAMATNPAGAAIFSNSTASFTLGLDQKNSLSKFYGPTQNNTHMSLNLSQAGGVLIFKDEAGESGWKKFTIAVNLNKINDFDNKWKAQGISSPTWAGDPNEEVYTPLYTHVTSQKYNNYTSGSHTNFNYTIAGQYGKYLSVGASFNSHSITHKEDSELREIAHDGNNNTVDAYQSFWVETEASGMSLAAGVIVKPFQNLRIGFAYTSPVWYELTEKSNMFKEDDNDIEGYYDITYSNTSTKQENSNTKTTTYQYNLQTPSKLTGSLAYVFGKHGLISADVTKKNYSKITLRPSESFSAENTEFKKGLKDSYKISLGTEWRIKKVSLRGGYSFEQSPVINAYKTDDINGFALGIGYNFGSYSIDLGYDYNENTDFYDIYPDFNEIKEVDLEKNNSKILATLAFVF